MNETEQVRPGQEVTVRERRVIHAPMDTIREVLESQTVVRDVQMYDTSDFVYGLVVEVTIEKNCSFQLIKQFRDLGLYIEHVKGFEDHETLHLRRIARLLERQGNHGKFDKYPEVDA